ncbi:phosphoribosylanthranilate isomerase [bacterium]|nr:MAG: phosphoribosylanthranilate isomerase [bacterium]
MLKVKVCGITNLEDALYAVEAGADALGFVFWKKSPRLIDAVVAEDIIRRLPPFITIVGVFVNEDIDEVNKIAKNAGLNIVQLHGDESPEYCRGVNAKVIKAIRVRGIDDINGLKDYNEKTCAFLLDAYVRGLPGGTGKTCNWSLAAEAKKYNRIILSGGLTPDNVKDAVNQVKPYAVDVSSGVEKSPGKKDHDKTLKFIAAAKG